MSGFEHSEIGLGWLEGTGAHSDIVLSTRVRLARNLQGHAFASRIRDADIASEAANLTKAQVLQQASMAALAQANSAPQSVLSLLRG